MMFIKYAAVQLQQLGLKRQLDQPQLPQPAATTAAIEKKEEKKDESEKESEMEEDEAKKIVESITDSITSGDKKEVEDSTKEIVKKAAAAVGSLKETEFDIRFNPDVFSPGVNHANPTGDNFKKVATII